ncbi:MAG TPA: DUF4381 family protein [Verrucomicrobiales bacterium]|nr:DUF4381 family protein [Verrucomicrobiales bacterium]
MIDSRHSRSPLAQRFDATAWRGPSQTGSLFVPKVLLLGAFLFLSTAAAQITPPPAPPPVPGQLASPPSIPASAPEEEDILGPREKVVIPVPKEIPWALWLSIGGGALAVALLIWWVSRRKQKQRAVEPAERALTELSAIDSIRNNLDAGPLADRSANVVRRFVAERFGIAAPQRTTEEFLHEVAASATSPLAPHSTLLRGFLKSCDMAKFAGAGFDAAERLTLLETARRFIRSANTPAPQASPAPPTVNTEAA